MADRAHTEADQSAEAGPPSQAVDLSFNRYHRTATASKLPTTAAEGRIHTAEASASPSSSKVLPQNLSRWAIRWSRNSARNLLPSRVVGPREAALDSPTSAMGSVSESRLVRRARDDKLVRTYGDTVICVAFGARACILRCGVANEDETLFAAAGNGGRIVLYDISSGQEISRIDQSEG
eukprot:4208621-Prymnesium_polylepis.1